MQYDSRVCCEHAGSNCEVMRVYVEELGQLLNTIDPSPFRERDLDSEAERFIVAWSRDLPAKSELCLEVQVKRNPNRGESEIELGEAVHSFFARRQQTTEREFRTLLRRGRTSLLIGLVFLSACVLASEFTLRALPHSGIAAILQQGLTVAGWVAMWRPMEIFLYSWWPLAGDRRLYERLARMPVKLVGPASPESSRFHSNQMEKVP